MASTTYFEKYRDTKKEWRWRLSSNYRIIAVSSEGYSSEAACDRSLEIVMDTDRSTEVR